MPWGVFAGALLVTYVLQTAVVGFFQPAGGYWPVLDLFLVLALLCALMGRVQDARIGAWLVGLAQDLGSGGALGVHAFALGLLAIVLTGLRELVNQRVWWVRLLAAFFAGVGAVGFVTLHGAVQIRLERGAWTIQPGGWGVAIGSGCLTAFLAALLAVLITQLPVLLSYRRRRRRYSDRL